MLNFALWFVAIYAAGMTWATIKGWPSRAYRVRQRSLRRDVIEEIVHACMWPIELALDLVIGWGNLLHRARTALGKGRDA